MSSSKLLDRLRANGVDAVLDGANVRLRAQSGVITDQMVRWAKRGKTELTAALREEEIIAAMPSGIRRTVEAIQTIFADTGGATVVDFHVTAPAELSENVDG